jgi:hypothetical protein
MTVAITEIVTAIAHRIACIGTETGMAMAFQIARIAARTTRAGTNSIIRHPSG